MKPYPMRTPCLLTDELYGCFSASVSGVLVVDEASSPLDVDSRLLTGKKLKGMGVDVLTPWIPGPISSHGPEHFSPTWLERFWDLTGSVVGSNCWGRFSFDRDGVSGVSRGWSLIAGASGDGSWYVRKSFSHMRGAKRIISFDSVTGSSALKASCSSIGDEVFVDVSLSQLLLVDRAMASDYGLGQPAGAELLGLAFLGV